MRPDAPLQPEAGEKSGLGWSPPPEPVGEPPAARPLPLEILGAEDRRFVLEGFRRLLPAPVDLEPGLRAVVRDLLDHPGSLARAQLAFGVLRDLGGAPEAARALAVAVEYFHTASLVFDDLPSMDDARERRGRPCPHRAHGEAPAVLGALALINRAYGLLWGVLGALPPERSRRAAALVEECLGAAGVLDGQARDLRFDPRRAGAREVLRVAAGKTVPLVRLSLVLPALAGGASGAELALLEEVSESWGFAYQTLDDFKDLMSNREETGKSPARDRALGRPNLPAAVGFRAAMDRLVVFLGRGSTAIAALERRDRRWGRLGRLQRFLEDERRRLVLRACE